MNQVWTKSLQYHFRRLYPHQTTIDINQLTSALRSLQSTKTNEFVTHSISNKNEDKRTTDDVTFKQFLERISLTYKDIKDPIVLESYFKLADKNEDGYITYDDVIGLNNLQGIPCLSEKVFLQLTQKLTPEGGKLNKTQFYQIIKRYI